MAQPIVIGIAGGSGAGKSVIAAVLAQRSGSACLLDLDSYYLDRSHLAPGERQQLNYDEPAAFDLDLLVAHVTRLAQGRAVAKPVYSFDSHTRTGSQPLDPAPIVIIEGLFTLWWEHVRALLDTKLFVDAPPDLRLLRRIRRDLAERGRTLDMVASQYLGTVRPMHERYIEPTRAYADVVVRNDSSLDACLDPLLPLLAPRYGRVSPTSHR